jgi:proton-dependent oligopeptide transporter, POT family
MTTLLETKQPKAMYFLALTEMCQRFAFWGVANLLVLFLVQNHHFSDTRAEHLFGFFTGIAFILPVLGGWIADKMNYRFPVIWGMLISAIGCFLVSSGNISTMMVGLLFIAIGGSIFTPSIYALLGSLYHENHHLRDSGFSIYYAAVNIGVFLAMIVLGSLGQMQYWNFAFVLAGIVQLAGFFPFRKAQKYFDIKHITPLKVHTEDGRQPPLHLHEKRRIYVILALCCFSILFWMAYNQGGSSMNLFALRYTDRHLGSFEMPPSWLLSSESLYLILFAFPLAKIYLALAKRRMDITPPMKSAMSLFAIGGCFLIMAIGATQIPSGATSASVNPRYLFSAYALMALGEMLIAPIGLSLITHLSPRRFTAMLVGAWYLCIGVAFYLGGMIAPWMSQMKDINGFFSIFVVLSFLFGVMLLTLVKKLNKMRYLQTLRVDP